MKDQIIKLLMRYAGTVQDYSYDKDAGLVSHELEYVFNAHELEVAAKKLMTLFEDEYMNTEQSKNDYLDELKPPY